jgi:LuxR family maltose regulon positive regulatory protein
MPPWWPTLVGALDATICLARGDEQQALSLAAESGIGPDYHVASCLRARVLLLCGRPQECLVTVAGIPAEWRLPHVAVFADALTAQALRALGRDDEAHATIERALTAAERFHLVAPFLAVGEVLIPLLTEHLERGTIHHELLPQILTRIAVSETTPANAWGELLTDREMAILRYLATNLSNVEIARAEFISVNTVKTHITHIYRKLGVGNRRAALRRAGELGLI